MENICTVEGKTAHMESRNNVFPAPFPFSRVRDIYKDFTPLQQCIFTFRIIVPADVFNSHFPMIQTTCI